MRTAAWPVLLRQVQALEGYWTTADRAGLPPGGTPFIPMKLGDFMLFLAEAVLWTGPGGPAGRLDRLRFLDVGCGPGGKLALAEALGLRVAGIDILATHVDQANRGRAVPVAQLADAREWDGYGGFDIVLLNRPVDGQQMPGFELRVMGLLRPGAVLIHANGWVNPGDRLGWFPVYVRNPSGPVSGVWQKPEDDGPVIREVEDARLELSVPR